MKETIKTYEYDNGFRCIYDKPNNNLPLASILCFVKLGSIHEINETDKGIAHFIEHMCFKGTSHISNTKDLIMTYDKSGAYFNAFTTKQYTCYVIKCSEDFLESGIHVVSDMLMNSSLTKKDCILERHIILEEMIRQDNNPEFHISKMKDQIIYSGSLFDKPIDDLEYHRANTSLPYERVIDMYNEFYTPTNMCLSVISHVPFTKIKKIISSSFFMKKTGCSVYRMPFYFFRKQSDIEYNIQSRPSIKATHVSISFRTCEYNNHDKYLLTVLSRIIGGSMTSRMFTLLREKNGITYTQSCSQTYYNHTGELTLYTMSDPNTILKNKKNPGVLFLLIYLLNDLLKNGITQTELTKVKGYLKGNAIIQMEDCQKQNEYNGIEYFIYDKPEIIPYDKLYDKCYAKITVKQMNAIIKKYICSQFMTVCLFGENVPTIQEIKSYCEKI